MKHPKKEFIWLDKSGGGRKCTWGMRNVQDAMKGERNWDGKSASTWALKAEVGDQWENAANKITRIK